MSSPTDPSYTAQALRTESPITPALQTRLQQQARLVHAVLGLQTEAGELADPVKKHIYYGRPLDPVNLREEIGDCLWYLAIACDALGTTLEAEQARNLAKLRTRYPDVFTAEAAQVRDLDRERQVLEGAEIESLRGAMAADDKRLRDAEERVWPGETRGCDAPDAMADEILYLRKQLADAQREASDEFVERQVLTAEQQQDAEIWRQQVDAARAEIEPLRRQLAAAQALTRDTRQQRDETVDKLNAANSRLVQLSEELQTANENNRNLVNERDAAQVTILAQRAGIELQWKFEEKVRSIMDSITGVTSKLYGIAKALAELDAGNLSVTLTGSPEAEGGK